MPVTSPRPAVASLLRVRAGLLGAGAVTVLALSACSNLSPATVNVVYPPSDGVQASLTAPSSRDVVKLRNFLVVGTTADGPGELIGALVNDGSRAVTVVLTADQGTDGPTTPFQVTVPAGGVTDLGPREEPVALKVVPGGPGAVLAMTASTAGGGSVELSVPVVEAAGPYATLAPRVTPSATATTVPDATATGTADPTATPEATSTDTAGEPTASGTS